MPGAKERVPDVIRISFNGGALDLTRSVDLTWNGLKAEVAQLMRCNPSQLMVSDIAMVSRGGLPQMSDDNALTLCATHMSFWRVTDVESEDDEMVDVQYD